MPGRAPAPPTPQISAPSKYPANGVAVRLGLRQVRAPLDLGQPLVELQRDAGEPRERLCRRPRLRLRAREDARDRREPPRERLRRGCALRGKPPLRRRPVELDHDLRVADEPDHRLSAYEDPRSRGHAVPRQARGRNGARRRARRDAVQPRPDAVRALPRGREAARRPRRRPRRAPGPVVRRGRRHERLPPARRRGDARGARRRRPLRVRVVDLGYADLSVPAGEDAPTAVLAEPTEEFRGPAYGPLKALCERRCSRASPRRSCRAPG